MAAKSATRTDLSSSDFNEESSSEGSPSPPPIPLVRERSSIKNYVSSVLHKHGQDDNSTSRIRIDPTGSKNYENISAFRQYQSNSERTERTNAQRQDESSDEDRPSMEELNLDPNPIVEERESAEQIYKQKVYLRQLQPPTPQPIEIQVQEVLIPPAPPKSPVHVRVAQREPRTPSPIVIKSAPPAPPPVPEDQPIVYNKYVPPPKQPPQQVMNNESFLFLSLCFSSDHHPSLS